MLSRPTTEQILLDCCTQLRERIAPALGDREAAVAAQMLEEVLRNCAVRAAHEIAWLHLDDVCAAYGAASASFEAALDVVLARDDAALLARARSLLDERLAHENEIMGEWGFVGRA
jgi:hypothetical protein